jgi:4-hydroxybenzoate polyprenyltransferase
MTAIARLVYLTQIARAAATSNSKSLGQRKRIFERIWAWSHLVRFATSASGAAFVFLLAIQGQSSGIAVTIAAATFCALGSGFALNDAVDIREDRVNNPGRPVARGEISQKAAILAYLTLSVAAASLGMLSQSAICLTVTLILICSGALYSLAVKHVWYLKNVFASGVVAILPLISSTRINQKHFALLGVLFLWSLEKEILMDLRDIVGDRKANIQTMAMHLTRSQIGYIILAVNLLIWFAAVESQIAATLHVERSWTFSLCMGHTALMCYLGGKAPFIWLKVFLRAQVVLVATTLMVFLFRLL